MKRYINIFCAAAAVLSFAACEKTVAPEAPVEEVLVGNVELSSTQVVFPVDGGTKTVLVNANGEWYYDCDYTWLSISANPEENSITFTADENTTGKTRYGVVSVICGDKDYTDCRDIRVVQVSTPVSLAADGETANCYITAPGVTYKFPATVKGNGKGDGNSKYIETCGVEINGAAYAELVWEATLDGDRTRSTYVIDGEPVFDGGNVYFTTGTEPGNAVIAVCDAAGEILWSWHIWVSAEEIATKTDDNGLVWMDRNLGALSVVPSEVQNTRGLFYQWGRKDPFPAAATPTGTTQTISATVYDEDGKVVKFPNSSWTSTEENTIAYSIANPTVCLSNSAQYASCRDWLENSQANDALWGNPKGHIKDSDNNYTNKGSKSIYDPCPVGYRVPPADVFSYFTGIGGYVADINSCDIADANGDGIVDMQDYHYGWLFNMESGSQFFPAAARFDGSYAMLMGSVSGLWGNYWSNSPNTNELTSATGFGFACLAFSTEAKGMTASASGAGSKADAYSVRCIKE